MRFEIHNKIIFPHSMLLAMILTVLFCPSVFGSPVAYSEGIIKWNTLAISTDPGVSLIWTSYADPAKEEWVGGVVGNLSSTSKIEGWGPASNGLTVGPWTGWGEATDNELSGISVISEFGGGDISLYGGSSRWGVFTVQGNGNITASVDYAMSFELQQLTSPGFWEKIWTQVDLKLGQYVPSPTGGGGLWVSPYDEDILRLTDELSWPLSPLSEFQSGTLSVSYFFSDGQTGRIDASGDAKLWASLPEPATTLLLGLGLIALVGVRKCLS